MPLIRNAQTGETMDVSPREVARLARKFPSIWQPVAAQSDAVERRPIPKSDRPRLVHIIPWDLTVGGIQRMVSEWCDHSGAAWDVHVISPGHRGAFPFPGATVHANLGRPMDTLAELAPDVLVHHGPNQTYARYAACPVVWVVHAQSVFDGTRPGWCDPVAVLSNYPPRAEDCGSGWDVDGVTPIPLGVDLDKYKPRRLVAGISGRLSAEKIPPEFFKAAAEWGNPGDRWEIRIIGNGIGNPYQRWVRDFTADIPWIVLAGDVEPGDMPAAYQALDVALVPSVRESGSYALVEALACGLPVIARNVGGIPFNAGDGAALVDDDDEFFAALDLLASELSHVTASDALIQAHERHSIAQHANAHSAAFCEALSLPTLDVLMPVYNTPGEWLLEAWESTLAQTYQPRRVVVVDDGSDDPTTLEALATIEAHPLAVVVRRTENGGVSAALNTGLEHCTAPWIARMDADDIMEPERLFKQARYLRDHPDVGVVGSQMSIIGRKDRTSIPAVIDADTAADRDWLMNHPTVVIRRELLEAVGGYEDYQVAQDLALWLTLVQRGAALHNMPDALVRYRTHAGQATARGLHPSEIARIRADHELTELEV